MTTAIAEGADSVQASLISVAGTPTGEERLRAEFYLLLAHLLAAPVDGSLLKHLTGLPGDDSILGMALSELAEAARNTNLAAIEEEFNNLFIGIGGGELISYGSHYICGFLHDKPLADLRNDLSRLGISRINDTPEPEDHVAALCEVMAGLIVGNFGFLSPLDEQREFFSTHVGSWMPRFFVDLENADNANFYRQVGKLGRVFIEIEVEAFTLT